METNWRKLNKELALLSEPEVLQLLTAERAGRPDRMIARFEQFLRAAPEAPERPDVQQALQAVRGR